MSLRIIVLIARLSISETRHDYIQTINAECHFGKFHHAECHYSECRHAECRGDGFNKNLFVYFGQCLALATKLANKAESFFSH